MDSKQNFPAGTNYTENALLRELADDLGLLLSINGQAEQPPKGTLKDHLKLLKAAIQGDWETAEKFLKDKKVVDYRILNFAVSTGHSIPFVEELVKQISKNDLAKVRTSNGQTPLHYAAIAGNTKAAEILVLKNPSLTLLTNTKGSTPLHRAAQYSHKETTRYLLRVTLEEIERVNLHQDQPSSFAGLQNPSPLPGVKDPSLFGVDQYPNPLAGLQNPSPFPGVKDPSLLGGDQYPIPLTPSPFPGVKDPSLFGGDQYPIPLAGLQNPSPFPGVKDPSLSGADQYPIPLAGLQNPSPFPGVKDPSLLGGDQYPIPLTPSPFPGVKDPSLFGGDQYPIPLAGLQNPSPFPGVKDPSLSGADQYPIPLAGLQNPSPFPGVKDPSLSGGDQYAIPLAGLHNSSPFPGVEDPSLFAGDQNLISFARDQNLSLSPKFNDPSPFEGERGVRLINRLITADFYDIALDVLTRYPKLAVGKDRDGTTALATLAKKPQAFPSGSNHGFCKRLIYNFFAGSVNTQNVPRHGDEENPCGSSKECPKQPKAYGFLQNMHDEIMMHKHALQILEILISQAVEHSDDNGIDEHIGPAVLIAAKFGIHEFVTEVIKAYPLSLWSFDPQGRNIFHLAIVNRKEKVFNLLYQLSSYKHSITRLRDNDNNNMLHLAAISAPSNRISGTALQMQRELQWFKEVEKVVQPSYKERENDDKQTPRELFSEEHENLVEQGEKWMKETAESCALVATLVLTVVFAAVFTVPGGNNQNNGVPIFSKERSFMIFAISNAFALFSSATSLLMFLGILTSRYSEEDFLRALPMRLSIGLVTLFFSVAAMLAAFSSALHILLSHQVSWIAVPIGLLACVPVTLFALLQFPLLVEIVYSTFGPSIFRKQNDEIIMQFFFPSKE